MERKRGRKSLYDGVICPCCGTREAKIKGMCLTCYRRVYYQNKAHQETEEKPLNQRKEGIKADLKAGMRQCDVARKYEVSRQYVGQIWKKMEVDKYAPR